MFICRKDVIAYQSIIAIFLVVIATLTTVIILQQRNSINSNWCDPEIQILREQLSDLWYLNGLDNVDIIKD